MFCARISLTSHPHSTPTTRHHRHPATHLAYCLKMQVSIHAKTLDVTVVVDVGPEETIGGLTAMAVKALQCEEACYLCFGGVALHDRTVCVRDVGAEAGDVFALHFCVELPECRIAGRYECRDYDSGGKNDWHYVTISDLDGPTADHKARALWRNRAQVQWELTATENPDVYDVSQHCPYHSSGHTTLAVTRCPSSGAVQHIAGPWGELYKRQDEFSE